MVNPEKAKVEENSSRERPEGKVEIKMETVKPWERKREQWTQEFLKRGRIEVKEEIKKDINRILQQEHDEKLEEFIKEWWEKNRDKIEKIGARFDFGGIQYRIEIARKLNAFGELKNNPEYSEINRKIENLAALSNDLENDQLLPETPFLILNVIENRKRKIEERLENAKQKNDKEMIEVYQQQLEEVIKIREEWGNKVAGENLRKGAENSEVIKEWDRNNGYISDKAQYIEGKYALNRANKENEIRETEKKKIEQLPLSKEEREKRIREIETKDYTEEIAKKLFGWEIQKKGWFITKRFEIVDPSGKCIREFKNRKEALAVLDGEIEKKLKTDAEKEWEELTEQRMKEINKLVDEEISKFAMTPEAVVGRLEELYDNLRARQVREFIERDLKKDPKTKEQLEKIKKEFEGEGKDPTEFIDEIIQRKGELGDLTGDLKNDTEKINTFLNRWGVSADSERVKGWLENRVQNYGKIVENQGEFLRMLINLIFSLILPSERR